MLREIERRATGWVARNLRHFDPDDAPRNDDGDSEEVLFARKAFVELALLVAYRVRLSPDPLEDDYMALLDHVEDVASRASYRELLARDHGALLMYGLTYAALRTCGREQPEFRWIVEQAVAARYSLIRERVPFRQLDLLHFLHLAGIAHAGPSPDDVLRFTLLVSDPNVVELEDVDAYAITHAAFYAADFGLREPRWPEASDAAATLDLVEALTRRFRLERHTDLVAELVAASICLGAPQSPEIDRAWRFLREAQAADGRVSGPSDVIDEERAEALGGVGYREWKTSYHTTMVVALAAIMARRAEMDGEYPAQRLASARLPGRASERRANAIRHAVERAARWLDGQLEERDLAHGLRAAAGIALTVGVAIEEASSENLRRFAARIDASLTQETLEAVGADTALLALYALRAGGGASAALEEALGAYAEAIDAELLVSRPAALPACAFLAELGKLERRVVEEALDRAPAVAPGILDGERGVDACARLLGATGGDPRRLADVPDADSTITDPLIRGAIASCRNYALGDAAVIVRGLVLAGRGGDRITRDAVDYLLSQQTPSGGFGYFPTEGDDDGVADHRLTWTIAVLWALVDFSFREDSPTRFFAPTHAIAAA
jgi:hypothetical protein